MSDGQRAGRRADAEPVLLLGPEGERPFDASALERELRAMWKSAAPAGGPLYRAALANVIVPLDPERDAPLDPVLIELIRRHPSRLFRVERPLSAAEGRAPLVARATALCHFRPGGGGLVCSEQIVLTASPAGRTLVPSAVASLLVGDLPVILLHLEDGAMSDDVAALGAIADVVLEDTATCGDTREMAAIWDRIAGQGSSGLRDIAWARLMPWRELLAEVFDQPEAAAAAAEIQDIVIRFGGAAPPAGAWLLAGWLASRLDWKIRDRKGERFRFDAPRRAVTLALEREPDAPETAVVGVRVRSGRPHPLDVAVSHRGRETAASVEFLAPAPRLLDRAFRYREFAACLVGEIQRHETNETFDEAARAAAELASLRSAS